MKTVRNLALLFLLGVSSMHAQSFLVDWFTVDGGGSTSTGGVYSVSGTIGQPDAGAMSGGSYSVNGGFWSLYAVQTPGAPLLKVFLTVSNTAAVSWPSPSTGYALQQNVDLATTNWTTVAQTPVDDGTNKVVNVNPPAGNRYFRLIKP